jgi:outer membrane protein assembly factor BamB
MRTPTRCTIGSDRVYLGVKDYGPTPAETTVVARTLDDGGVEWSVSMPYSGIASPMLGSDPGGDPMLFAMSGQDNSNTGPGKGVVRALDPGSGDGRWEWSVGAKLGGSVVADGTLVATTVSLDHVAIYALDAAEGTKRWSFPAEGWLHNTPTVHDGTVYLSSAREELAALALDDGSVRWRTTTKADDSRPVVDRYRDLVYVGHQRGLEAFGLDDEGTRAWDFVTTDPGTPSEEFLGVIDEPVVMADQLAVHTMDTSDFEIGDVGHCYGVNPDTGSQTWQLPGGRPASSIIGAGGHLVVRRADSASAIAPAGGAPTVEPEAAAMVAVQSDGSVAWTRRGRWRPVAIGNGRLIAYRGPTESVSGRVAVACFAVD